MKRTAWGAIGIALAVVVVAVVWWAGQPAQPEPGVDVRGTVTSVSLVADGGDVLGVILVEGRLEPDTTVDKASVTVTRDTAFFVEDAAGPRPLEDGLGAIDLQGKTVEVKFAGAVAESYPVQATASRVAVLL